MSEIVIFGTGGFAKEVHDIVEALDERLAFVQKRLSFIGFLDEDEEMHGKEVHGAKVLGGLDWLNDNENVGVIVAIGSPASKRKIVREIKSKYDVKFPVIVDPKAEMGSEIQIGEGTIICAGTIITTDVIIKDFVTINLACTIGHDSVLGNYVTVAPGVNVSGNCNIKEGVDFGTGGAIIQGKTVEEWSIIGAGSVVVKDIPANTTAVGNPSKVIKEREVGWHL